MQNKTDETNYGSSRSFQDTTISFEELGIESTILNAISELGFQNPTPIQKEVIPLLFENTYDLIGLAQTGTGKTAAFGLPLIQYASSASSVTKTLILCPTRELCLQISKDFKNFAKYKQEIRIVPIYGGASIEGQFKELKGGAHIIAATPGRVLDMINRGKVDVSQIETLVLDEADEMLNMGFKEELDSILENTPSTKRTLLFSATMSEDIQRIALKYMHDPIEVTIGRKNEGAENVNHVYYLVHAKDRYLALKRVADYNPNIYSIIFCRTRAETQEIADKLMTDGYNADALHGDLSQAQRDSVMQKFRTRKLQMLVATDVAARGLDVEGLTHIINFSLPDDLEHYTHRSGRTGRAGKTGTSIAIINLKEKYKIKTIEKTLGKKFKQEKIPSGREICEKQLFNLIDRMENVDVYNEEIESFLPTIYKKLEWLERDELIKRFVSIEFNYFLDYYKNTEDINVDAYDQGKRVSSNMSRFFINLGRKDDLSPQTLIGMINDISRSLNIRIGKIDIMHSFSFFEAESNHKDAIISGFEKKKFKGRRVVVQEADQSPSSSPRSKEKEYKERGKKDRKSDRKEHKESKERKDRKEKASGKRADKKADKKKKKKNNFDSNFDHSFDIFKMDVDQKGAKKSKKKNKY
ncbi:MAG: DEAD/DEAH box helicase [Candidatus Omnitrophota bacterium]